MKKNEMYHPPTYQEAGREVVRDGHCRATAGDAAIFSAGVAGFFSGGDHTRRQFGHVHGLASASVPRTEHV